MGGLLRTEALPPLSHSVSHQRSRWLKINLPGKRRNQTINVAAAWPGKIK